jgi:hypothetical protein
MSHNKKQIVWNSYTSNSRLECAGIDIEEWGALVKKHFWNVPAQKTDASMKSFHVELRHLKAHKRVEQTHN